eukprot:5234767-Prymnesium_polylepis.1
MRLDGNPGSKFFAHCGSFDPVVCAHRNVLGYHVMHENMRNRAEGHKTAHERMRKIELQHAGPTSTIIRSAPCG